MLEPLSGYLLLAERLYGSEGAYFAEGWNFGPYESDARSVEWIADYLCRAWGDGASWRRETEEGDAPHEAHYLKLDCSKARGELGWRPRLDLQGALEWIVQWTRSYAAGDDMIEVTNRSD